MFYDIVVMKKIIGIRTDHIVLNRLFYILKTDIYFTIDNGCILIIDAHKQIRMFGIKFLYDRVNFVVKKILDLVTNGEINVRIITSFKIAFYIINHLIIMNIVNKIDFTFIINFYIFFPPF